MALFKCKICGGALEVDAAQSVAVCEYCGTRQTLPRLDSERRTNLYDRAGHFRRNNDFDKAMGIFEQILNEDPTDAEAYWSLVLCRYGIEYVEDPETHRRVPTVNRAQFTSIFDDEDYRSAIQHANEHQRELYEAEAAAINEIQKGILSISQKEAPFDVFICYKETDHNGRRTQDSVLAQDLYYQLTQEGFRVFFSRITLEDKLGSAYEPYIFAALNSAKVMVVLGTRPEHFNAVWVKNEWGRFLSLIKGGARKTLIPAYRDMDPYDLPEEFSHLQAQDMSKLGFMQDLIRGIRKIAQAEAPKAPEHEPAPAAAPNVAPLLRRAFMFLEDGEFRRADDFCEQVLNQEPENARAYLGKLMAEMHVKREEDLLRCGAELEKNGNYQRALRFADAQTAQQLHEIARQSSYNRAKQCMLEARDPAAFLRAAGMFEALASYKDAAEMRARCVENAKNVRFEGVYQRAVLLAKSKNFAEAAKVFATIPNYKDAAQQAQNCQKYHEFQHNDGIYQQAMFLIRRGTAASTQTAIRLLEGLGTWRDSPQQLEVCQRTLATLREKERAMRKRRLTVAAILLGIALLIIVLANVIHKNTVVNVKHDGVRYELCKEESCFPYVAEDPKHYHVVGYTEDLPASVVIPAEVKGRPVLAISDKAFRGCETLQAITLPTTLTHIGKYAFADCDTLTAATFEDITSWHYGSDDKKIFSADLYSPETAARYLRVTYTKEYWYRY